MSVDRRSVHVLIAGRVQGVGYRAWTRRNASALGLAGWVRNRADGRVEALFAGPADVVERMLDACRRGPDMARVTTVDATESTEAVSGPFEQRPTV